MNIAGLLSACLLVLSLPVSAQGDPRIVEQPYDPDIVFPLTISRGHATVVQLQRGEVVESIVVGNAEGWLVEPTASADRVVVKPLADAQRTNLTILTTRRSYAFTLDANGGLDMFVMRFVYPAEGTEGQMQAPSSYQLKGDRELFPRLVTDNGQTTSVFWKQGASFPAVFVLDESREEIAAVYRAAGDGLIINGVHEEIIFRSGDEKARALRRRRKP